MTAAVRRRLDDRVVAWGLIGISLTATAGVFVLHGAGGRARAAMMAVAFLALAAAVVTPRRVGALSLRAVVVVSLLAGVAAIVPPPLESTDVWTYAIYGRMVTEYDVSPYTHAPNDFPEDPYTDRSGANWRDDTSMYGPAHTAVSVAVMAVAREHTTLARVLFQIVVLAAFAASVLMIARATGAAAPVAAFGMNPLILYAVVNNAHLDILIGACILAAVFLAVRSADLTAGLVVAAAIALKLTIGLVAPALVFWVWYRRGFARACATGAVIVGALVGVLAVVGRFDAISSLEQARGRIGLAAFWHVLAPDGWGGLPEGSAPALGATVATVAMASTVLAAIWLGFTRRRDATPALAMGAALTAYLVCAPYVLPWYAAWVLPVLALSWRSGLAVFVAVQTAVFTVAYQLELSNAHGPDLWALSIGIAAVNLVAIVVLVVAGWRRERDALVETRRWVAGDSNPEPAG